MALPNHQEVSTIESISLVLVGMVKVVTAGVQGLFQV
jgi:hypothetical protein